ncbi:MAG: TldD/PmbA family protein, partial [bacterium]|nr:TldD/PmbA family protein [bacterium]
MKAFLDKLIQAGKDAGLEACEAFLTQRESFSVMTAEGEILEYKSNATRGLGFRGVKNGKMGYAGTEAFDDEAIAQLVKGVVESAELCEDTSPVFLYDGKGEAPQIDLSNPVLNEIAPQDKIDRVLAMEKVVKAYDPRVDKSTDNTLRTTHGSVRIVNSYGMDRSYTMDVCSMFGMASAKEGERVSTGYYGAMGRSMTKLDAKRIGTEAAKRAVEGLSAEAIPSGKYRVVIANEAMVDLLETFCGIFSAEVAQKGLSLLSGRVGEQIAAPCVTLVDDPLMEDGMASRPFDDEGVPSAKHTLVENGVFRTFLHNLKTAHKDGVETTGNAGKASYDAPVRVEPSNLYLAAGKRAFDEMLESIGEGVVITGVSGLHAGANAVSGDFSLLSKGYTFKNGKREKSVEQITLAGNFYELLR